MELRQNVTKLMSQTSNTSNDARKLKWNEVHPSIVRSDDIHFNEVGVVLKEFDSLKNPTIPKNPTCPNLRPQASTEDCHAQPKPKGIITSPIITELKQDLNSKETSCQAHDNQKNPRVSTQASRPHWTRIVCVNNKPTEELS